MERFSNGGEAWLYAVLEKYNRERKTWVKCKTGMPVRELLEHFRKINGELDMATGQEKRE